MRRLLVSLFVAAGVLVPLPAYADHDYDEGYYEEESRCSGRGGGGADCSDDDGDRKRNCVGFVNFCNITVPEDLVRDLFGGGGSRGGEEGGSSEEEEAME